MTPSISSQADDALTTAFLASVALILSPLPTLSASTARRPVPSSSSLTLPISEVVQATQELRCQCEAVLVGGISCSFVTSSFLKSTKSRRERREEKLAAGEKAKEIREHKRRERGWQCEHCQNIKWITNRENTGASQFSKVKRIKGDRGNSAAIAGQEGTSQGARVPESTSTSALIPSLLLPPRPSPIPVSSSSRHKATSVSLPIAKAGSPMSSPATASDKKKRRSKQPSGLALLLEERRKAASNTSSDGIGLKDFLSGM